MSTYSRSTASNPRWSEADPDEDMFAPEGDDPMSSPTPSRTRTWQPPVPGSVGFALPANSPAPTTPQSRRSKKRAAATAQLTPHAAHTGPSGSAAPSPANPRAESLPLATPQQSPLLSFLFFLFF